MLGESAFGVPDDELVEKLLFAIVVSDFDEAAGKSNGVVTDATPPLSSSSDGLRNVELPVLLLSERIGESFAAVGPRGKIVFTNELRGSKD